MKLRVSAWRVTGGTVFRLAHSTFPHTVEKYCRAGKATDDNMAHAHCMLDTQGYKHTLRICNAYCFSTTTMVPRTRLYVTSRYVTSLGLISLSTKAKTGIGVLTVKTLTVSCIKMTSHIRRRLFI